MSWFSNVVPYFLKLRNRHFFAADVLLWSITPTLALQLRLDGDASLEKLGPSLGVVTASFLVVKVAVFLAAKLYYRYWRYASVDELVKIAAAMLVASALQSVLFFSVLQPTGLVALDFPRSVPLLDGMIALLLVGALRCSVRIAEHTHHRLLQTGRHGTRVLIVGAGNAGLLMVREMQSNPHLGMLPVGFVDDDPHKQKLRIRGIDVMGYCADLPRLVRHTGADMVVIAMPKASGKNIREISAVCQRMGIPAKVIPGVYEMLDGKVSVSQLRDVQLEDLLRRAPVQTDTRRVHQLIRGARVLVTGGGGSIGSELCRQLLRLEPAELVLLGHGENSIFLIEGELRQMLDRRSGGTPIKLHSVIADIRDHVRMREVFRRFRPEIIFHAAAHKHVPLMEGNVADAVTNNVLGTRTVLELAEEFGVQRFVMISTDKAVNPSSVMGSTKRVAELLVRDAALRSGRPYVAVRFGNVLGSRGSVVQVFRQQIARGEPITITHPEVKRYFMTIPEAVQLVLQAGAMGKGGEIFALDMGEPVRISDLARDLIRLSGRSLNDVEIVYTGLRPGEKMFEEVFGGTEAFERTEHEKIFVSHDTPLPEASGDGRPTGLTSEEVRYAALKLVTAAQDGKEQVVRELLASVVAAAANPRAEQDKEGESREGTDVVLNVSA